MGLPPGISLPQQFANAQDLQTKLAALPAPQIAPVSMGGPSLPPISAPALPSAAPNQVMTDQDKLQHLRDSGSGASQIHKPFLRGLAEFGDTALNVGAALAPELRIAGAALPGTTLRHNLLVHQAQQNLAADQAVQQQNAKIQQENALADQEESKAESLKNPEKAVDPSKTVTTDDGVYQLDPKTGLYDTRVGDRVEKPKPIEEQAFEYALGQGKNPLDAYNAVYGAKNQKTDSLPQQYLDAISSGDTTKAGLIKRTIEATQVQPKVEVHTATERPESTGTWTPGFDADKNPVMFNSKTGEVKPMASFTKNTAANQKISSDEQKRADLAQNMNENIDRLEDILTRRPELFGPLAGRMTEAKAALGSSDPDVAQLMAIEHQLGMVAQGAHGMRSAQGVEAAAHSLTNGFKNSPDATRAGLEAARQSVKTFLSNSQNPGQPRSAAPSVGQKVTLRDGKTVTVTAVHPDGSFDAN